MARRRNGPALQGRRDVWRMSGGVVTNVRLVQRLPPATIVWKRERYPFIDTCTICCPAQGEGYATCISILQRASSAPQLLERHHPRFRTGVPERHTSHSYMPSSSPSSSSCTSFSSSDASSRICTPFRNADGPCRSSSVAPTRLGLGRWQGGPSIEKKLPPPGPVLPGS